MKSILTLLIMYLIPIIIGVIIAVFCYTDYFSTGTTEDSIVDPIPICPSCKHGTVREWLRNYELWVEAPLVYDSNGKIISRNASVEIDDYKCYICGTFYSWYYSSLYGSGYYTEGLKF